MSFTAATNSYILKGLLVECLDGHTSDVDFSFSLHALAQVLEANESDVMEQVRGSVFWLNWQTVFNDPDAIMAQRVAVTKRLFEVILEVLINGRIFFPGDKDISTILMLKDELDSERRQYVVMEVKNDTPDYETVTAINGGGPTYALLLALKAVKATRMGKPFGVAV